MEFGELVELVKDQPVFDSALLLSGDVNPGYIRRQLNSWVQAGKIIQLRRGLYMLAPAYRKITPHPFLLANRFKQPSYVSYQSALAYYGLIPEGVYATVSATTRRPGAWVTELGTFQYHHVQQDWFNNYRSLDFGNRQMAFVALPEKALLDLVILTPRGDSPAFIKELRLQNLEMFDLSALQVIIEGEQKPKLTRFLAYFKELVREQAKANRQL